jgi:hypothetical protein
MATLAARPGSAWLYIGGGLALQFADRAQQWLGNPTAYGSMWQRMMLVDVAAQWRLSKADQEVLIVQQPDANATTAIRSIGSITK